ncbi:MAG: hypothetical protein ACRDO1_21815 [Nocardioidaceae bacterium]
MLAGHADSLSRGLRLLAALVLIGAATRCGSATTADDAIAADQAVARRPAGVAGGLSQDALVPAMERALATQTSVGVELSGEEPAHRLGLSGVVEMQDGSVTGADVSGYLSNEGWLHVVLLDRQLYFTNDKDAETFVRFRIEDGDAAEGIDAAMAMIDMASPQSVVTLLDEGMEHLAYQGSEMEQGVALDHYYVTLDMAVIAERHELTDIDNLPETMGYDLWLEPDHLIRHVRYEVNATGFSFEQSMDGWGRQPAVTAPPSTPGEESTLI